MSVIALARALIARPDPSATTAWKRGLAGLRDCLVEARRRQAVEDLRRHGLRLPRELEEAGLRINERNEDSLPFA